MFALGEERRKKKNGFKVRCVAGFEEGGRAQED
jgi:hypothetical protein